MEGVPGPYKGYTPAIRKARITRLILMPIYCRFTPAPPRKTKPKGHHPHKALLAAFVRTAPPGRHCDGNGPYFLKLWLDVRMEPTGGLGLLEGR